MDSKPHTPLDTAATLALSREASLAGGENPVAPGREATAGVAPYGRESVQGKDEQQEGSFLFFQTMMEGNTPPPGVGATNRDWIGVELQT